MLIDREAESRFLGQAIPMQDHQPILMDTDRMESFKAAIQQQVFAGAKVLELGGGTGVLSWFAAQTASKVYCVEMNPEMVAQARRLLARNHLGERVEMIHADAFDYLPPEPVDIVICDMLHVALLREKQLALIEDFKRRYIEKFGGPLPIFLPEAVVMAVQPSSWRCSRCNRNMISAVIRRRLSNFKYRPPIRTTRRNWRNLRCIKSSISVSPMTR